MRFYTSLKYDFFKYVSVLIIFLCYFILTIYQKIPDFFNITNNKDIIINMLLYSTIVILIFLFFKFIIYRINYYELDKTFISQKKGLFNNFETVSFNNQLVIKTHQNLINFLTGTITVEIEADGDAEKPEIILKNIPYKYYEELKKYIK